MSCTKAYGSSVNGFSLMTSLNVKLKRRDFPRKFEVCCFQYLYLSEKLETEGVNIANDRKAPLIFKQAGCPSMTFNDVISERNVYRATICFVYMTPIN